MRFVEAAEWRVNIPSEYDTSFPDLHVENMVFFVDDTRAELGVENLWSGYNWSSLEIRRMAKWRM